MARSSTHRLRRSSGAGVWEVLVVERFPSGSHRLLGPPSVPPRLAAPWGDPRQGEPLLRCPPPTGARSPPRVHSPGAGQLLQGINKRGEKIEFIPKQLAVKKKYGIFSGNHSGETANTAQDTSHNHIECLTSE